MTVYIDVLFAINFSMDFLALFLTNLILFKKIHKVRILIASLIGGLYGTLEFFVDLNFMWTIVTNIAVTFLMCTIAFEKSKGRLQGEVCLPVCYRYFRQQKGNLGL